MKGFISVGDDGAIVLAAGISGHKPSGTVRDTSGAVLPGVTVEATSPALISRGRATDGSDSKIVSLSQLSAVTFVASGFNAVRQDGIELDRFRPT